MHLQSFRKFIAILLTLATIGFNASGITFRYEVLKQFEEKASAIALLTADDSENPQGNDDFKPPKSSFVDYTALCSNARVLSEYRPGIDCLWVTEPFQFIPEVYPEIFVPPQNLA